MDMMEVSEMEEEYIPNLDATQIPILPVSSQTQSVANTGDPNVDDGVIEKIVLKNFMCHKHFQVELDGNINFIIGRNGSGKSAIMTGIITGLGGKASTTQRANTLSNFVRTGSNEAEIIITLRNRGIEAYKPEEYGRSITVVRQIKRDGGGSYKLKGASGKTVSTVKDDLSRIMDHFNIQVDNPVSMLSQDTSRNFLHSSHPSAKYRLFMKGTHLDQIANDYARAEEQQKLMIEEINRKMSLIPELKRKAKELEEEVQLIGSLDELEVKLGSLSLELSWALVKKSEEKAVAAGESAREEEKKLKKIQEKFERVKSEETKRKEEANALTAVLEEISGEASLIEKEREEIYARKRETERFLRNKKAEGKSVNNDMEKIKAEKKMFEDKLEECRKLNIQDLEGERKEVVEQKEGLERQLRDKRGKLETANNDKREKESSLREKEMNRQTSSEVKRIRDQISDCEDTIKRLQSAGQNSLNVFGTWMLDIVRTIERNRNRFRKVPKGPIGSFVKVKDQNWCYAIECAVGFMNLCGFIVDNQNDGDILRGLINQALQNHRGKPNPPVFTSSFDGRVYDVSGNMPHCSYPNVLSMVEVNDPDVLNMLIDMCSIETTILIRDKREARQVMGDRPPRNARNAYTIEGDQALPNHRYYSNKRARPMGILQASVHEGIQQQKRHLEELQLNLTNAINSNDQFESTLLLLKRDCSKINDYIRREQRNVRQLQSDIEGVKVRLEEIQSNDQEEDIATWEGIIKELENKLNEQKRDFLVIKEEMSKKLVLLRSEDETLLKHEDKVKQVAERLQGSRREFKGATDKLEKLNHIHRTCDDQIKKIKDRFDGLEMVAKQLSERAVQHNQETISLGARIDTNRTPTSIESEINKIEEKLKQEAGRRANQDEIEKRYMEAMDNYKATESSIMQQRDSCLKLKSSLNLRIEGYRDLRMRIANRARLLFQNSMEERGYEGTLKFNIKEKRLEIIAKVDKNQATKNVASLSGGERSFTTVSFIMALWEAIECPFRCFDEFDVFMDLLNRRISMRLMLDKAKSLENRQFIFFTPQDMSGLGIDFDSYKVLQLHPPDRTQRTLDNY